MYTSVRVADGRSRMVRVSTDGIHWRTWQGCSSNGNNTVSCTGNTARSSNWSGPGIAVRMTGPDACAAAPRHNSRLIRKKLHRQRIGEYLP